MLDVITYALLRKQIALSTPTDDDMLALLASMGFVDPASAEDGAIYVESENTIFVL